MKIPKVVRFCVATAIVPLLLVQPGLGWGREGHEMINRLATEALPKDMPEFLRNPAAVEAMVYYGPEPDRWKSRAEPELSTAGSPEHYIDLEDADLIGSPLPRNRYDFVRALEVAQKVHPERPLSAERVGLQPYAADEQYQRIKAAMRDYRELLAAHKDTHPVECEIVFLSGILGHFVADASMPLHTSTRFNGWVGPNPNHYTEEHHIHGLFESEYVSANITANDVRRQITARPQVLGDFFDDYMKYLRHSNTLVEKTYELEKAGGFTGAGTPEAKTFTEERLAAGATELRDILYTAWVRSADPLPEYRNGQRTTPPAATAKPQR